MAGDWKEKKFKIKSTAHKFKGTLFINMACTYLDFNMIFVKKNSSKMENTCIVIETPGTRFKIY